MVYFDDLIQVLMSRNMVFRLITLISFAQLINLLKCLGLLVLLRIETAVHIEVRYLLLGVYGHILLLFDGHLLIYLEHRLVIEVHLDILEAENRLHGHKQWDAGLDGETLVGVRQLVLQKELVELADLLAAEREHVDQRKELVYVERVGF